MFILKSYSILRKLRGLFCRSSHRSCSVEKGVLRNFAKFTGKHLCHLFFNKIALKKRLWHTHVFSCEFCKLSKNTFFVEHLWATASVFILWRPEDKFLETWAPATNTRISQEVQRSIKVGLSPSKKKFVLFASVKALKKWWKILFISY